MNRNNCSRSTGISVHVRRNTHAGAIRLEEALYSLQKRRQGYSITHPMGIERTLKIKSLSRRLGRKEHHSKPGTTRLP